MIPGSYMCQIYNLYSHHSRRIPLKFKALTLLQKFTYCVIKAHCYLFKLHRRELNCLLLLYAELYELKNSLSRSRCYYIHYLPRPAPHTRRMHIHVHVHVHLCTRSSDAQHTGVQTLVIPFLLPSAQAYPLQHRLA